jgi:chromosome segregation ATPase
MRKEITIRLIILATALAWESTAVAQDSRDKHLIKLEAKISEDSAKLVKFQSMVSPFEKEKSETADNAQQSADDNKKAAERLSNDPQDKRLARKARNAATDAKRDARRAREASDKLDDLNSDIRKLTKQLAKEKDKRQDFQGNTPPAAPTEKQGGGA